MHGILVYWMCLCVFVFVFFLWNIHKQTKMNIKKINMQRLLLLLLFFFCVVFFWFIIEPEIFFSCFFFFSCIQEYSEFSFQTQFVWWQWISSSSSSEYTGTNGIPLFKISFFFVVHNSIHLINWPKSECFAFFFSLSLVITPLHHITSCQKQQNISFLIFWKFYFYFWHRNIVVVMVVAVPKWTSLWFFFLILLLFTLFLD